MSEISKWFAGRRSGRIRKMFFKHADEILETIKTFHKLIEKWCESGSLDPSLAEEVKHHEKEADNLRRSVLRLLAESPMEPDLKTYFARVIRRADFIADWALEAVRILEIVSREESPPEEFREMVRKMVEHVVKEAEKTNNSIKNVYSEAFETLELCDQVEGLEEEVDRIYQEARITALKLFKNYSTPLVVFWCDLLEAIEMVADICEDTCDNIRELVVRQV